MVIQEIRIRNFKALKNVALKNLPALAVFVGQNGVGKTTLFRVFFVSEKLFVTECPRGIAKRRRLQRI